MGTISSLLGCVKIQWINPCEALRIVLGTWRSVSASYATTAIITICSIATLWSLRQFETAVSRERPFVASQPSSCPVLGWWPSVQGVAKVGLQLWGPKTELLFVLLFSSYCIVFHIHNCKLTLASPCMSSRFRVGSPAPEEVGTPTRQVFHGEGTPKEETHSAVICVWK